MLFEECIYLIAILAWVFILVGIYYSTRSSIYVLFGMIPLICLGLIYYNLHDITEDIGTFVIQPSVLPVGIILAYGLLDKIRTTGHNQKLLSKCILAALILSIMSVPPYYFGQRHVIRTLLIKLALQIISGGLFVMVLSIYFIDQDWKIRMH